MTDHQVVQDYDELYDDAYNAWSPFYPQAEQDLRFFLGDQWDEQERRELYQEGRNAFSFNKIRRTINFITGYQRSHRLSSVVSPIESDDQLVADQLSQMLMYVFNYGNGYNCISDTFAGACKTGMNLLNLYVDYRDDMVNGDIKFSRDPYNGFIMDPYFTQRDLSDCSYVLKRRYISLEEGQSLLPKFEKEVEELYAMGWNRDDKFNWLPYQRNPGGQDMLAYNEFYQMKWKKVPFVVDMESGEAVEMDIPKEYLETFLAQFPQLKEVKKPKQYIEKHIIVNGQYIKTEINPYGLNEYPFVPIFGTFEPESDQWALKVQSLIRPMVDPQREINRRKSQMVDLIESQINSGWIADENSVVNPRSLMQSGQGRVIWRKTNSGPNSVEKIPPAQIPPSMFQLNEMFDQDLMQIAGVNESAFGMSQSANDSGVMMQLRQASGIVNLQDVFDNLRFAQKIASKKVVKLIQQWHPKKITRVLGQEMDPRFKENDVAKYDIVVQEGMLTDTQRQMYFRQLVDLKQLGAPITGEMLAQAAPIQGKSQFNQQIAEMEKAQQQAQQQQQQVQQELLNSQMQLNQSKAISDIALGKERFTRSVANLGLEDERASQAVENRADSALSRARAMKELESMEDDRFLKYLQIINLMEANSKQSEQEVKQEDVAISAQANEPVREVPEVGGLLQELDTNQMGVS